MWIVRHSSGNGVLFLKTVFTRGNGNTCTVSIHIIYLQYYLVCTYSIVFHLKGLFDYNEVFFKTQDCLKDRII